MKLQSLLPAAVLLGEATARPYAASELARRSPGDVAMFSRQGRPGWCYELDAAIKLYEAAPEKYQAKVFSVGVGGALSGFTAYSVCRTMVPGQHDCEGVGYTISSVIWLVGGGVAIYKDEPLSSTESTMQANNKNSKRWDGFKRSVEDSLNERGLAFEAVNVLSVAARDEDGGVPTTNFQILGLREENGVTADHEVRMRADGSGAVRVSFPREVNGSLERRGNGADFLISYNAYKYNLDVKPAENGIKAVADGVSKDWAQRMDQHQDWSNYIAALALGPEWGIAINIVPESGNNWPERVASTNICGKAEI